MKAVQIGSPDYAARIRRAQHLASAHPFAAEVLNFYAQLAAFQQKLHSRISRALSTQRSENPVAFFEAELPLPLLLPDFPELLALLQTAGPTPVRESGHRISQQSAAQWQSLLTSFWFSQAVSRSESAGGSLGTNCHPDRRADVFHRLGAEGSWRDHNAGSESWGDRSLSAGPVSDPLTDFILRAFLQPYAELLAARMPVPELTANSRVCPRCGSLPLLGVLRPEADGGKRFLMCSFCLQEWEFRRIFCAACGEDDEKKLPVYVAEQFPHIRVEACETCKFYLRTIDLTKNGHAIPVVDDLAALPLSLWAHEHAFTRIHENLLGT
jgi:formate dehydrogenase maturation protein FdhE